MSGTTTQEQSDTPIGRALARRVRGHLTPERTPGSSAIDLTAGEPDATPTQVRQAAKAALDQGETHYTDANGILPLREAISGQLGELGFAVEPDSLGVTNGGTEALYIALQVALKPGDRAAVVEPMPSHILDMVTFIGAEPVRVETRAEDDFLPDPAAVARSGARLLLLASPSPATGKRIPDARLEQIIASARANEMDVILDLSYAAGLYAPEPVRFENPTLASEIVLIGSLSHAHGMAGWRVGFFSAPPANRGLLLGLKASMSICTTSVSQHAAIAALSGPHGWLEERRASFAANRDRVTALLHEAGLDYVQPDAYPPLLIDVGKLGGGDAVAEKLAAQGVLVDPGSSFGASTAGYIRIDLGAPADALTSGVKRLVEMTTTPYY